MKMIVGSFPLYFVCIFNLSESAPPLRIFCSKPPHVASLLSHDWAFRADKRGGYSSPESFSAMCLRFFQFSDTMGNKSQPHFNDAVLEVGGEDGEQKQHNIDLNTHSDFRCLQN